MVIDDMNKMGEQMNKKKTFNSKWRSNIQQITILQFLLHLLKARLNMKTVFPSMGGLYNGNAHAGKKISLYCGGPQELLFSTN